jgi:hypothetical protein
VLNQLWQEYEKREEQVCSTDEARVISALLARKNPGSTFSTFSPYTPTLLYLIKIQ